MRGDILFIFFSHMGLGFTYDTVNFLIYFVHICAYLKRASQVSQIDILICSPNNNNA